MGLELARAVDVGPTLPRQRTRLGPTRHFLRHSRHHQQPRRRPRRRRRIGEDRRDGHRGGLHQHQFGPARLSAAYWKPKQCPQLHGPDPVR